jgi:hypothetical protein
MRTMALYEHIKKANMPKLDREVDLEKAKKVAKDRT